MTMQTNIETTLTVKMNNFLAISLRKIEFNLFKVKQ